MACLGEHNRHGRIPRESRFMLLIRTRAFAPTTIESHRSLPQTLFVKSCRLHDSNMTLMHLSCPIGVNEATRRTRKSCAAMLSAGSYQGWIAVVRNRNPHPSHFRVLSAPSALDQKEAVEAPFKLQSSLYTMVHSLQVENHREADI